MKPEKLTMSNVLTVNSEQLSVNSVNTVNSEQVTVNSVLVRKHSVLPSRGEWGAVNRKRRAIIKTSRNGSRYDER
jgi:hypothetical protein